jgi:quercetin dioxygenase-like cupin family protein
MDMAKRRDLLKMMPALLAAPAQAQTKPLATGTVSAEQLKPIERPFGEARIYCNGPTDLLKLMNVGGVRLKPGASPHPPHQHPEEELLLVTEGSGEITLDGKPQKAASGSLTYCAPGVLHGITNTGTAPMQLFFFRYRP